MIGPKSRVRFAATALGVAILAMMLSSRGASASMLTVVPSSPTLLPGGSETVSVLFTATQAFTLTAADIEVAFDSTRFTVSNVTVGTLDPSSTFFPSVGINAGVSGPGTTTIQFSIDTATAGIAYAAGTVGTLETFTLTALANAPVGGSPGNINLLFNAGITRTDVFSDNTTGGPIVLTPPPTNGFDATVDGTVLIGAAVPEPSSLILMGLGGGLITLTTALRKKARRHLSVA